MKPYYVKSDLGWRTWQAEDEQHARDQHDDAFPDEGIDDVTDVQPWHLRYPELVGVTADELAARIPAHVAQLAVVRAIAAAGSEGPDWDSDTIEHVLNQLPLHYLGEVPNPYSDEGNYGEEFWEGLL